MIDDVADCGLFDLGSVVRIGVLRSTGRHGDVYRRRILHEPVELVKERFGVGPVGVTNIASTHDECAFWSSAGYGKHPIFVSEQHAVLFQSLSDKTEVEIAAALQVRATPGHSDTTRQRRYPLALAGLR